MMMIRMRLAASLVVCVLVGVVGPASAQVPMGGTGAAPTTLATLTSSGSAQTLVFAAVGNAAYDITLTGNTVFTLSGGTAGQFQSMTLLLRESGLGGYVPNLPSAIQWASGVPPSFNTLAGAVNTVMLSTSDGGKTIAGLAGGAPIGTVAGTARDAAAAIVAETAAATAAASETTRALAAESALLPKIGTTVAGLSVSAAPTAAQFAAVLPAFSSTAQGLVPVPPSGANLVLGQGGWLTATGGGNVSTDTAGTISGQVVHAAAGSVNRTLSARASDVFNARDFGAVGNGATTLIGTTYGSTLAALASYATAAGATPFSWATNPVFGLTFTMTTTSAQSAAGSTLNFVAALAQVGGGWATSGTAPWQAPVNGNYLLRPGMLVSGSCVASGTYVGAMPYTAVRQGELLPGSTDWAGSTAYAVGAVVFANGGVYKATTAGTSAAATAPSATGTGGPSGTGTGISDGTAVWGFVQPAEYTNLPNGAVTLVNSSGASLNTSSACASGTAITFTIAPAQLQALTIDWLGVQTAIAQAWAQPSGGAAYLPAGLYQINHALMNPGGTTNTSAGVPNVAIVGDSSMLSQLQFTVDLGQDECGVAESNRGPSWSSFNQYRDFRIFGQGNYSKAMGVSPNKMDGLCIGETASAQRLQINNVRAGISLTRDHQVIRDYSGANNGYGILFAPYSQTIGNQEVSGGGAVGDTIAAFGIASTNQFDSGLVSSFHTGFAPYGFYSIPNTPNVTTPGGAMLTNDKFQAVYIESVGAAWIKGSQSYSNVNVDTFDMPGQGNGMVWNGFSLPNGSGGTVQPTALIDVEAFIDNTAIETEMNPYGAVSDAVIETRGGQGCPNNVWVNDASFVSQATLTVPMVKCASIAGDRWQTGTADGLIAFFSASSVTAGQPVADFGGGQMGAFAEGRGFAGIALLAVAQNNAGPLVTHATGQTVLLATSGSSFNYGDPLFVTATPTPGVAKAVDPAWSIGTAGGAGSTTIQMSIEPLASRTSMQADTGETATVQTSPSWTNCYQTRSGWTEFASVPANGCAIVPIIPLGRSVSFVNDDPNGGTLTLILPPGFGWRRNGSNQISVPANASGVAGAATVVTRDTAASYR